MINSLFITWDGCQTYYIGGLFTPIFHEIEKIQPHYKFHYLQFTCGNDTQAQQQVSQKFIDNARTANRIEIRSKALEFFSLEAAAESYMNAFKKLI